MFLLLVKATSFLPSTPATIQGHQEILSSLTQRSGDQMAGLWFRATASTICILASCSPLMRTAGVIVMSWQEAGKHTVANVIGTSPFSQTAANSLGPLYYFGTHQQCLNTCKTPRSAPSKRISLSWRNACRNAMVRNTVMGQYSKGPGYLKVPRSVQNSLSLNSHKFSGILTNC